MSLTELYETLKSSRQFDNITKEEVETHMKDLSRHLNDIKGLSSTCWVTSGSETYYFDPRVFKINEDMGNETKETSEEVELLLPMKIAHYEIHHENVRVSIGFFFVLVCLYVCVRNTEQSDVFRRKCLH